MTDALLKVENVVVDFRTATGTVNAVRGVNYEVARGETLAVVGESGSGKSVTARAIMSMLAENAIVGHDTKIIFDGEDISNFSERQMQELRGNRISMIFQEPLTSLNPFTKLGIKSPRLFKCIGRCRKKRLWKKLSSFFERFNCLIPKHVLTNSLMKCQAVNANVS